MNQDPNSKPATCYLGCGSWDRFWRRPQVFATTLTGGDVVATIVNWRERIWSDFEFRVEDLGIIPTENQVV